jgi:hypothetical protein
MYTLYSNRFQLKIILNGKLFKKKIIIFHRNNNKYILVIKLVINLQLTAYFLSEYSLIKLVSYTVYVSRLIIVTISELIRNFILK